MFKSGNSTTPKPLPPIHLVKCPCIYIHMPIFQSVSNCWKLKYYIPSNVCVSFCVYMWQRKWDRKDHVMGGGGFNSDLWRLIAPVDLKYAVNQFHSVIHRPWQPVVEKHLGGTSRDLGKCCNTLCEWRLIISHLILSITVPALSVDQCRCLCCIVSKYLSCHSRRSVHRTRSPLRRRYWLGSWSHIVSV